MPILTVKISGKGSRELTQSIGDFLMDTTSRILKKKKNLIAIAIQYVDHDNWFVGGKLLSSVGKNSFYFDIRITDETNTKDEKAQFIKESYEGFERIIGNIHEESYIHIHDVRASAYGYGGKTQEFRYHH